MNVMSKQLQACNTQVEIVMPIVRIITLFIVLRNSNTIEQSFVLFLFLRKFVWVYCSRVIKFVSMIAFLFPVNLPVIIEYIFASFCTRTV